MRTGDAVGAGRMRVIEADITGLALDAIVNAANPSLLGGGGVDGAIHRAAGPELLAACRELGGCPPGEARITPGFRLPAGHVIHTVGPIWQGGEAEEDETLAACYRSALSLAHAAGLRSIAFPAISTGVYGFPAARAAPTAVAAVRHFLAQNDAIADVVFCCRGSASAALHRAALGEAGP